VRLTPHLKSIQKGIYVMKVSFTKVFVGCLVALSLLVAGMSSAQQTSKEQLRVNGAGMASDLVDKWAKKFMEQNSAFGVVVIGSSAGKGFQALLDGSAEIAMMSREVRPDERQKAAEKGLKLAEKIVGRSGVVVVTHPRNPVSEVNFEQLRKIYAGEYDNWKQLGGPDEPIRCMTRKIPESGGAVFFWNTVLHGEPFGRKTVMTETWGAILTACEKAKDLPIGILPHTRDLSRVKVLAIKKDAQSPFIVPKEDTVKNGTYPLTLEFSFAWNEGSNGRITAFVDFCLTQSGRQ